MSKLGRGFTKRHGRKLANASGIYKRKEEEPESAPRNVKISEYLHELVNNFHLYAEGALKIQTKAGQLVPMRMNSVQRLMEQVIRDIRMKERLVRLVILKARREGISTWTSGRFYWKTTTNRNRYSMIITHEPEATDFIFKMHKRFQQHIPEWLRPAERYNNKKMLEFNTEAGDGLDSAIRVGTAGKEDFGSSQLIHYLHLSELAKYPRHTVTGLLTAILQCVPPLPDTEVIMESTAKGVGGEFYDRFWNCRYRYEFFIDDAGAVQWREVVNENAPEDSEYTGVFIPWFVFEEYRKPAPEGMVLTDEEKLLQKQHNLTREHLAWRRWCIANNCNDDVDVFNQEYPDTPMNAFLSKADNVFNPAIVLEKIKDAKNPIATYQCQVVTGNFLAVPFNEKKKDGVLQVWNEPSPGKAYLISGDVAEGVSMGDFSSLDILEVTTGRQVAHWRGHIPPDQLGMLAVAAAKRYNMAMIAIERNNHGLAALQKIQDLGYTNVYFELIAEHPPARPRKRLGWYTTKANKPLIIDMLAAEIRERIDLIQCKETLQEMLVFKQFEDGTLGAEVGHNDDRVMSIAIGKYLRTKSPLLRKRSVAANLTSLYNTGSGKRPAYSSAAWT